MNPIPETRIAGDDWAPRNAGECPYCEAVGIISERMLPTAYEDPKSNFITSCETCWQMECERYDEMWREYNAGRL